MRNEPVLVTVVLPGGDEVLAGRLRATNVRTSQSASFRYDDAYLADPRAYELDPDLPLADWPTHTPGRALFRAMSDSTPDRWGRALLDRKANQLEGSSPTRPRSTMEIDYLLAVHDETRQGALRYRYEGGEPLASSEFGVPRLVDLDELLSLTDDVVRDPNLDADLRDLIAAGSSLGGARPKASVRDGDGTLQIAKFPKASTDTWDVPGWEMLAREMAARCQIDVPPARLVKVLGRNVLLLDRFDRDGARRLGYKSAITLVQGSDGDHANGLADVADFFEAEAQDPDRDLPQMYRRALFSLLVSNTDNHLRNHGFLRDDVGWRLSPAFDINPNPQPETFNTPVGSRAYGADTVADALRWCEHFRVTRAAAVEMLGEILETTSRWRACAAELSLPAAESELMANAFESPRWAEARAVVL